MRALEVINIRWYLIAIAFIFPLSVMAYNGEEAAVNLSHEMATCSAYLTLVSESVRSKDKELADKYDQFSFNMFNLAVELSNSAVTQARMEMAFKGMMTEINNDRSNISILMNQYQELCADLSRNPEIRFQYWLDKKD